MINKYVNAVKQIYGKYSAREIWNDFNIGGREYPNSYGINLRNCFFIFHSLCKIGNHSTIL